MGIRFPRLLPLISLVAAVAAGSASAKDFRSESVHPLDFPAEQSTIYMGKLIAERTAGKHRIEILPRADAGSESFLIGQIRNGSVDMARISIESFNDTIEMTVVPSLPFLFKSRAHLRRVLDGPIGEEILAAFESKGLVALCFYDVGSRSLYASKPIRNVADLKDMKVRVQMSNAWAAVMRSVGATPVRMAFDQVHEGLRAHVIDAAENTWSTYISSRDYDVAKFYSVTRHSMAPEVLVFSKINWDLLAKQEQAIIRAAARESVPYFRNLWDEREASSRTESIASHFVTDIDITSFADAFAPVRTMLLSDPKLQDLAKRIEATDPP